MDFDFVVHGLGGPDPISAWSRENIGRLTSQDGENFKNLVDVFGMRSAKAQALNAPITDIYKLRSTDQRLYIYATRQHGSTVVMGGLKVGSKRLFIRNEHGAMFEIEPTCVLDFHVHEAYQRKGIGKELFEHFLMKEQQDPACVGYDRPSPKLLAFLAKHYGLRDYVPQSNNFVVFSRYFQLNPQAGNSGRRDGRVHSRHPATPNSSKPLSSSQPLPHSYEPAQASSTYSSPGYGPSNVPNIGYSTAPVYSHSSPAGNASISTNPAPARALDQSPSFGQRWSQNNMPSGAVPAPSQGQPPAAVGPVSPGAHQPSHSSPGPASSLHQDSLDDFRTSVASLRQTADCPAGMPATDGPTPPVPPSAYSHAPYGHGASFSTLPGGAPAHLYSPVPAHMSLPQQEPRGMYTPQESSGRYPPQEPSGRYPPQEPSGRYPPQESSGRYPPQEPSGRYPPQESSGRYPPQEPAARYTPQPPWGVDERQWPGPRAHAQPSAAAQHHAFNTPGHQSSHQPSSRSCIPVQLIPPYATSHGQQSGGSGMPSGHHTPSGVTRHQEQGGMTPPGGSTARAAGMAQRSGSGAAGCLVW